MLKFVGNEAAQDEVGGRSLLDEIAREGARRMLVAALETEVAAYLEAHRGERDDEGHALVVRNGKGRARKLTVGAGTIPVSAPRVNDRRTDNDGQRRRFTSRTLPPYMRRSPKVAEVWCLCSTCAASPPATSARPWQRCSGTMRPGCPPPPRAADQRVGGASIVPSRSAASPTAITFTSGLMVCTSTCGWRTTAFARL